ncbi:hypothetical protein FGB62_199g00 [Gracilaria domingensis]|nr:hypothetical protein FGB62_199g00 [Gracilaria domingensis]
MFANVVSFMDMKYVRGVGPSFLRVQGNVSLSVPSREVRQKYLWSGGPHSLNPRDYSSTFLRGIVANPNIGYLVPRLYEVLQPRPDIARDRYRNLFLSSESRQVNTARHTTPATVDISADAAEQGIVVRNYQGEREGQIEVDTGSGPLLKHTRGRPMAMRAFIVDPTGLFRSEAPVARLVNGRETHHMYTGNLRKRTVKYRRLRSDSKAAEMGAFPLLYPYGDLHFPYDMVAYIDARGEVTGRSRGSRSSSNIPDVNRLTWAEHTKRRLYTDNI